MEPLPFDQVHALIQRLFSVQATLTSFSIAAYAFLHRESRQAWQEAETGIEQESLRTTEDLREQVHRLLGIIYRRALTFVIMFLAPLVLAAEVEAYFSRSFQDTALVHLYCGVFVLMACVLSALLLIPRQTGS